MILTMMVRVGETRYLCQIWPIAFKSIVIFQSCPESACKSWCCCMCCMQYDAFWCRCKDLLKEDGIVPNNSTTYSIDSIRSALYAKFMWSLLISGNRPNALVYCSADKSRGMTVVNNVQYCIDRNLNVCVQWMNQSMVVNDCIVHSLQQRNDGTISTQQRLWWSSNQLPCRTLRNSDNSVDVFWFAIFFTFTLITSRCYVVT